nr:zinc finger, CCHC-type [Tanacetum cinerariifolium]
MLMTIKADLQRNLETLGAYDMLKELKTPFSQQAEHELLQIVREFHACKNMTALCKTIICTAWGRRPLEAELSLILIRVAKEQEATSRS